MAPINTKPATQVFLDEIGYPGLWVGVRNGISNEDRRFMDSVSRKVRQFASLVEKAEKENSPPPETPEDVFVAVDLMLSRLVVNTNITEDEYGNHLPPPTDVKFWDHMGSDIKDALVGQQQVRADQLKERNFTVLSNMHSSQEAGIT
jgi:hypothetical protein